MFLTLSSVNIFWQQEFMQGFHIWRRGGGDHTNLDKNYNVNTYVFAYRFIWILGGRETSPWDGKRIVTKNKMSDIIYIYIYISMLGEGRESHPLNTNLVPFFSKKHSFLGLLPVSSGTTAVSKSYFRVKLKTMQ